MGQQERRIRLDQIPLHRQARPKATDPTRSHPHLRREPRLLQTTALGSHRSRPRNRMDRQSPSHETPRSRPGQTWLRPLRCDQSLAPRPVPHARHRPPSPQQEPRKLPPRRRASRLLPRLHGPRRRRLPGPPPAAPLLVLPRRPVPPRRSQLAPNPRQLPLHGAVFQLGQPRRPHARRRQPRRRQTVHPQLLPAQIPSRRRRGAVQSLRQRRLPQIPLLARR